MNVGIIRLQIASNFPIIGWINIQEKGTPFVGDGKCKSPQNGNRSKAK